MLKQFIYPVFLCCIISLLSSCSASFYLVRHAEKGSGTDPQLTAAGLARAEALRDSLSSKDITRIFVTNYQRTQQTAEPLSVELGIEPIMIYANQTDQLVQQLKAINNANVLVVGHSNTIPVIIDSLMRSSQGVTISETDFDNLFKVKISRGTSVVRRFSRTNYGQPTN